MRSYERLFIRGEWVPSTGAAHIEVICPWREGVIGRVLVEGRRHHTSRLGREHRAIGGGLGGPRPNR